MENYFKSIEKKLEEKISFEKLAEKLHYLKNKPNAMSRSSKSILS